MRIQRFLLRIAALSILSTGGGGCNVNRFVMAKAVGAQADFFNHDSSDTGLDQLSENVYTFAYQGDRGIIITTEEGLVVSDTFNERYTAALLEALALEGIDPHVHLVIYSHHHLDHTHGAQALTPDRILAHRSAPLYWNRVAAAGVAPPTELIEGPQTLVVGGTRIDLLDTSGAHAPTLLALYLPKERILYAPDTLTPLTFQLGWTPEVPLDGYFETIDTLGQIPFDTFVASHFGYATRGEFEKTAAMQKDVRATALKLFEDRGISRAYLHYDKDVASNAFIQFYDEMSARYGDWHGFDENILPIFIRLYTSELLGDVTPARP